MARPNYSFAKRQRELAKKKKKEAKRLRKAEAKAGEVKDDQPASDGEAASDN
jgi:hypothetical protein